MSAIDHFPPGYKPRPQQVEAIKRIEQAFLVKPIVAAEFPTGSGKSHLAVCMARATRAAGGSSFLISSQKILQEQYAGLWPPPEIEVLKGRNAYQCNHHKARKGDDCSDAPCTRRGESILKDCVQAPYAPLGVTSLLTPTDAAMCPYWRQVLAAHHGKISCFNFSSFLFQQRLGRFGSRDLLIIDEAHNIEAELMNFVRLELFERDLELADISLPRVTDAASLVKWMDEGDIEERIKIKAEDLKGGLERTSLLGQEDKDSKKLKDRLESLVMKVTLFRSLMERARWVVGTEDQGPKFGRALICRPIHARSFAKELLLSKGTRVLAMSATILSKDVWCRGLGLWDEDVEFVRMGSDFPVKNRPIVLEYVGPMD